MLKIYNTMTRIKEEFKPLNSPEAGIYTCGPTVYNYAHIGNLRAYITSDILKRILLYNGYKVKHIMNITDVGHLVSDDDHGEDKMEKGAAREKKTVWEIAEFYTEAFKKDAEMLNILPPTVYCKATDHIKEQIDMVRKIEENGYTYIIEDGIYFDTSKLKDYGKLAKLDIEGLQAGRRVDVVTGKKNSTDFALWKFSPKDKQRAMEWDSPWGKGFPGWHIECSAMSLHYLGEIFDIHTGGIDHIPVHHTNEIAQSQAALNKESVRYWVHNEFLIMGTEKMAKSGESFIRLQTLIDRGIEPLNYRYFNLNSHYRSPLTFTMEGVEAAGNAMKNLKDRVIFIKENPDEGPEGDINSYKEEFENSINDDLNTPKALSAMWTLIKDSKIKNRQKLELLLDFDKIFGFGVEKMEKEEEEIPDDIKEMAEKRQQARKDKNWALADEMRDKIQARGYKIADTPDGPVVEKA